MTDMSHKAQTAIILGFLFIELAVLISVFHMIKDYSSSTKTNDANGSLVIIVGPAFFASVFLAALAKASYKTSPYFVVDALAFVSQIALISLTLWATSKSEKPKKLYQIVCGLIATNVFTIITCIIGLKSHGLESARVQPITIIPETKFNSANLSPVSSATQSYRLPESEIFTDQN